MSAAPHAGGRSSASGGRGGATGKQSSTGPLLTTDGWEIIFNYRQKSQRVAQSMRSLFPHEDAKTIVLSNVGADNTAAYAAACFEMILEREEELADVRWRWGREGVARVGGEGAKGGNEEKETRGGADGM